MTGNMIPCHRVYLHFAANPNPNPNFAVRRDFPPHGIMNKALLVLFVQTPFPEKL